MVAMRMMMVSAMVFVAACGGTGTGPLTLSETRDVCRDVCQHEEQCGELDTGETVATCTEECAGDLSGGYRGDVIEDFGSCVANQACGAEEDLCLECSPTSAHDEYETRCRAKATECGVTDQSQADGLCEVTLNATTEVGFFCIYTPEVIDAMRACFDEPCTGLEACFETVATRYGVDT